MGRTQRICGSEVLPWAPLRSRPGCPAGWGHSPPSPMKEISPLELVGRFVARFAAVSGVIALLVWITWVMLDIRNLQSGFTLP